MNTAKTALLGVGNILENDDGIAVYAAAYLEANYRFTPEMNIINGGVEGINLLDVFIEHDRILILDAIEIEDAPGSIYHIPAAELTGYGLNSGGAHEVGVLQCLDMLELMGRPQPVSSVLGIVPEHVEVRIGLTETLRSAFKCYIDTALAIVQKEGIAVEAVEAPRTLQAIIERFDSPKGHL